MPALNRSPKAPASPVLACSKCQTAQFKLADLPKGWTTEFDSRGNAAHHCPPCARKKR